jgi:uncharacterized membrane protein
MKNPGILCAMLVAVLCFASCDRRNYETAYPRKAVVVDTTHTVIKTDTNLTSKDTCKSIAITYTKVAAIIEDNCNGCHNATDAAGSGGSIVLDSYNKLTLNISRVVATIKKKPTESLFMPKGNPDRMDTCLIKKIDAWVLGGMKNN